MAIPAQKRGMAIIVSFSTKKGAHLCFKNNKAASAAVAESGRCSKNIEPRSHPDVALAESGMPLGAAAKQRG